MCIIVDVEQITGSRYYVNGHQTDHRMNCWIECTNLTVNYVDGIVVRSDWFHYCITVYCTNY